MTRNGLSDNIPITTVAIADAVVAADVTAGSIAVVAVIVVVVVALSLSLSLALSPSLAMALASLALALSNTLPGYLALT